jgi:MerR family transcriptional regulator, light-induced transcriptional regulator
MANPIGPLESISNGAAAQPGELLVHGSERAVKTDVLSTRQVAHLLGVGEATVKRWADAGEIDCFRTPGGHRKFRLRDVTAFVQRRHFQVAEPLPAQLGPGEEAGGEEAIAAVETSALAGDASALVAQMAALRLHGHDLAAIFDGVVAPALQRIGSRWEGAKLNVAEEHVGTQAFVDAIARAQPLAEPPGEPNRGDRGTAVVAAVAGEQHDVAARMTACLLRARGFEVLAPLAATPAGDLAALVQRSRPDVVALAATIAGDARALEEQVELTVRAARGGGGRVVVGGTAMAQIALPQDVPLLRSMRELEHAIESVGRRR